MDFMILIEVRLLAGGWGTGIGWLARSFSEECTSPAFSTTG